jgi:hypothetical protein
MKYSIRVHGRDFFLQCAHVYTPLNFLGVVCEDKVMVVREWRRGTVFGNLGYGRDGGVGELEWGGVM